MKKILVVSGHPNINNSFANKVILDELEKLAPQAEFRYLDKLYPSAKFDVEEEQRHLEKADIIVFDFPIFWYGMPAFMKKWLEDVFTHGFAYGSSGNKLHNKKIIFSFTSGASEATYQEYKINIDQLMIPYIEFARLCGLRWQNYVYSGGYSPFGQTEDKLQEMRNAAKNHARKLNSILDTL